MADITFTSIGRLQKYLKEQVNDILKNEMAGCVKDYIQSGIDEVVYQSGVPKRYKRRGGRAGDQGLMKNTWGTGSIADKSQMHSKLVEDGVLEVTDDAERNTNPKFEGIGYDTSKSLAENIVKGYGDKQEWYNEPRDFMGKAVEIMKETKPHLYVLGEELKRRTGVGVDTGNTTYNWVLQDNNTKR